MESTPNDFKLIGTVHAILEYSTHETATFELRLALRLFEKKNNDLTTTASIISNPLLHVRPPRAGGIACYSTTISKSMSSSASHRAHGRGEGV